MCFNWCMHLWTEWEQNSDSSNDSGIKKQNRQVDLIYISLSDGKLFCIIRFSQLIQTFLYFKECSKIKQWKYS